ncbi:MAG: RagB/SusD family nutrient uptake outer membrane protein, partial [Bacteroidetes bacterium]|nr:RagB/SusD family nutrient uptake outer membrane protein [Bacteroidota bacterium]
MNRKYVFAAIVPLVVSMGCKKILDVDQPMYIPMDEAIQSGNDVERILLSAYDGLQSGNVLGGNFVMFADLLADDTKVNENNLYPFGTLEIYNRTTTMQIGILRSCWADCYRTINKANTVIDAIDNNAFEDEYFSIHKERMKGEALFIRAVVHYELIRFWTNAYDIENQGGNTSPGIPYRLTPTKSGFEGYDLARNTVEECYDYIIADLIAAEQFLTISNRIVSVNRASAMAATAYLARVYFYKGDYANALASAETVINSGKYSFNENIADAFRTNGNTISNEVIFQVVFTTIDQNSDYQGNAIRGNYSASGGYAPLFQGALELKDLFLTSDTRRYGYISYNPFRQEVYAAKYTVSSQEHNVCIIRLQEIYLIAAEAYYYLNDTRCYDIIRILQHRAHGEDYNPSLIWKQLPEIITDERRRELIFEGDRYHNLRRLKQPLRNGVAWNDPSLLFKIP